MRRKVAAGIIFVLVQTLFCYNLHFVQSKENEKEEGGRGNKSERNEVMALPCHTKRDDE